MGDRMREAPLRSPGDADGTAVRRAPGRDSSAPGWSAADPGVIRARHRTLTAIHLHGVTVQARGGPWSADATIRGVGGPSWRR